MVQVRHVLWGIFLVGSFCGGGRHLLTPDFLSVWILKVWVVVMILLLCHKECLWVWIGLRRFSQLNACSWARRVARSTRNGLLRPMELICLLPLSCLSYWLSVIIPSVIKPWTTYWEMHTWHICICKVHSCHAPHVIPLLSQSVLFGGNSQTNGDMVWNTFLDNSVTTWIYFNFELILLSIRKT